ncbi:hypothetical protein [Salisediminibacterium halotolerans]|uniref:hypothetical protein n=1 Tax=Salisediminibacterium halotolerans TaxID=517425 RepID=UPI000B81EFF1|nr:hypothetical protein [Salisediminibacterium haloalkalitolerans]
MTSIDVILKGTDDDASSVFFPRASAEPLRAYALQGLACLAIPQEKAGMLGHPACFKQCSVNFVLQSKKATKPLPPAPPGKQETKIRIRRSKTAEC